MGDARGVDEGLGARAAVEGEGAGEEGELVGVGVVGV